LKDPRLGYADVTPLQILTHLFTTYGTVTPHELSANFENMNKPWDPNQPIEDLYQQLEEAQEFAAEHEPIIDATKIRTGVEIIEKTGLFELDVRDWRAKAIAEQTYANFKVHFTNANKERARKLTSASAGFAGTAKAAPPNKNNNQENNNPNAMFKGRDYCWTCGLQPTHNGKNCRNKQDGHKDDATINNMKGGNPKILQRRGEKTKWQAPASRGPTPNAET